MSDWRNTLLRFILMLTKEHQYVPSVYKVILIDIHDNAVMRNEWYCVNDPGWHNAGMLEIWRKKKVFVAQCKTTILCEELLAELTNHLTNHDQLRLTVHYTAVHCNWSIKSESINWFLLWKDKIVPHSLNWDKYWNVHDVRELIITLTRICWMVSEQLKGHKFFTEFKTFNCNCQHQNDQDQPFPAFFSHHVPSQFKLKPFAVQGWSWRRWE